MARIRLATEVEAEREKAAQYRKGNVTYDLSRLALLYGRFSTEKQTVRSIQSAWTQSQGLIDYAIELGWIKEVQRILFVENSVAKRGYTSGTTKIEKRPGLNTVCEYIDAGKASAVFVEDVSRLFRDETAIEAGTFAAKCKAANCVVITTIDNYVYDFNNPFKDDTAKFVKEALEAGAWLRKHVHGKMLKDRAKKAEQGKLANGASPIGLMRKYEPNEKGVLKGDNLMPSPHREQVKALYERFSALQGSHSALLREIVALAKRGIPWFPVVDGIDPKTIKLTPMQRDGVLIGWTVASLFGLKVILSNPAYDGHLVWHGVVVKRNAHEAIVPHDLWQYAFDHTATLDLDGREMTKRTARYQLKKSIPTTALMASTRYDGRPVIDGINGAHVYVMANTQSYVIRRLKGKHTVNGFESGIHIVDLDKIIEEKLMFHVETGDLISMIAKERGPVDSSLLTRSLGYNLMNAINAQGQERVQQQQQAPTRLDTILSELKKVQRDLDDAADVMDRDTRREKYARVAELKHMRIEEEKRVDNEAKKAEQLEQARADVKLASQLWKTWDVSRRQRFIRVATESITLHEIADGWLKLTVVWSAALGGNVESCYIWRPNGSLWTKHEQETLQAAYPGETRKTLLYLLPKRSWTAIRAKAKNMGIRRTVTGDDSDLPENLSISDRMIASEYGLKLTHTVLFSEKPGIQAVQWVSEQACNGACSQ